MPRPGFVLEVDPSTPPVLFRRGDSYSFEQLPPGRSRVIYAPEPFPAIDDVGAAIGDALLAPEQSAPLQTLLAAARTVTIRIDDPTRPLPVPARPDIRQRITEAVLDLAASAGIDDVAIVSARGLSRRATEAELRSVLGDRVADSFLPAGLLSQHDAEGDTVTIGRAPGGVEVAINRRIAESDLVVTVEIADRPGTGHHLLDAFAGVLAAATERALHEPSPSLPGADADSVLAGGPPVFRVIATVANATSPAPLHFLGVREWEWRIRDRIAARASAAVLDRLPNAATRRLWAAVDGGRQVTTVTAGDPRAAGVLAGQRLAAQQQVAVAGRSDIVTVGVADRLAERPGAVVDPLRALGSGLAQVFGRPSGDPVVRPGGVVILAHPLRWQFHPVHSPAALELVERALPDGLDAATVHERHEARFAADDWFRHLYRTSYGAHPLHPVHLWYRIAAAAAQCAKVIAVGAEPGSARRLGVSPASTLDDAFEIAADAVGPSPTVTHLHTPPVIETVVR